MTREQALFIARDNEVYDSAFSVGASFNDNLADAILEAVYTAQIEVLDQAAVMLREEDENQAATLLEYRAAEIRKTVWL